MIETLSCDCTHPPKGQKHNDALVEARKIIVADIAGSTMTHPAAPVMMAFFPANLPLGTS